MFQRRSRSLKQAIDQAGDSELRELQLDLQERQERIAQLEFEISDTNAELGRFEHEYDLRVGVLERQARDLEADLEQARFKAARRAQWGDRADSPDMHVDVIEQFRRTWTPKDKPPTPPPEEPVTEATKAELKTLFRALAKRFHPDLVTDPEAKRWRHMHPWTCKHLSNSRPKKSAQRRRSKKVESRSWQICALRFGVSMASFGRSSETCTS